MRSGAAKGVPGASLKEIAQLARGAMREVGKTLPSDGYFASHL